jgi:signal transduction histidine kinase
MRWSIRYQLLVPLAVLLPGLVGICTWTALDSANLARRRISEQVDGSVRSLSEAPTQLTKHVLELARGLSGAEYLAIEPDGHRISTLAAAIKQLPPPGAVDVPLGDRIDVEGRSYFCRGVFLKSGANAGSTLYVLYPESHLDDVIRDAVRPSLLLGVSAGLAALIVTVLAGQHLMRRTRELERRTRQIAGGDFSPMPLPKPDDELRDLAKAVNEMAEKLAQFQDRVARTERVRLLGQVSGGLAHQLRNAVTGTKLAVQLHAQSCAGGDSEALQVAERQLSRMAADLQRFFDVGLSGGKRSSCSLRDLIDEAVALLRPQCRHAEIELSWQAPEDDIRVVGDVGQLGHAILNVIGNAVEAVGANGVVEVRLSKEDVAVFEVIDTGPGPKTSIAERIFEPFVTGKSEGVGLGLAVTKQVVEGHGGRISWRREDARTIFRIELPTLK